METDNYPNENKIMKPNKNLKLDKLNSNQFK